MEPALTSVMVPTVHSSCRKERPGTGCGEHGAGEIESVTFNPLGL